ncbi:hypothetical protein NMD14_10185 [Aeromonas veronii]
MGNVVRLATASAPTTQRDCNVNENRRSGFVLLYKSIKDATFYRDPSRKSLWLHLLLEVTHERTEDTFNGNRITLSRGQLVGSARSLGEACGVSEDSARRSLDAFERDGMITRTAKQGTKGYTLITVLNYDPYQRGVSEHDCAELGAELEAASDMGLQVVSQSDCAELGAEFHAEALNNINNKTKTKDLNTSAEPEKIGSAPVVIDPVSAEPVLLPAKQPAPQEPAVITMPLNSGEHAVTESFAAQMQALYPAVDVAQELRTMTGWLIANPTKRKTKTGINRFINAWLSKCQDRGGSNGLQAFTPRRNDHTDLTKSMTAGELNRLMQEGF